MQAAFRSSSGTLALRVTWVVGPFELGIPELFSASGHSGGIRRTQARPPFDRRWATGTDAVHRRMADGWEYCTTLPAQG
jgi:hypothetical protein